MLYKQTNELYHHGIKGQKWGIRRYQNEDGTLTEEGKRKLQEITTLAGRVNNVEIDSERAKKQNSKLLMAKDDLSRYQKDRKKLDSLLNKYAKENIYFTSGTRIAKDGKEYFALAFENGKRMEDMPIGSIYEYELDLRYKK